jgi:hypothetical protein
MKAEATVTVEGISQTIAELTKYNVQLTKDIEALNKTWAKAVINVARSKVLQDTGGLKRSIKAKYFKKDGPAATVFPRGNAGSARHLVEYGTGPRVQRNGRYTGRMRAVPFMAPAQKSAEGPYAAEVLKLVNKDVVV